MLVCGLNTLTVGTLLGLTTLVIVGAAISLPAILGWSYLRFNVLESGKNALSLQRYASPNPAFVGTHVQVCASIIAERPRRGTASKLHRLGLSAQAPRGLGTGSNFRLNTATGYDRVQLTYALLPTFRGEWPLGSVYATRTDVFGVARNRTVFSDHSKLRVWPAVLPNFVESGKTTQGAHMASTGRADPSDEDSSLRPYQPGDDLRRVHWASAAKHSELMVRVAEGASPNRATVILDLVPLPPEMAATANQPTSAEGQLTEWAVSIAASVSLHLIETGHQTRLVTTSRANESAKAVPLQETLFSPGGRSLDFTTQSEILDQLVTVSVAETSADTFASRAETLAVVSSQTGPSDTLVCVLTPPAPEDLATTVASLTQFNRSGRGTCVALISINAAAPPTAELEKLLDQLLRSGWSAVPVDVGSNLEVAWNVAKQGSR